MLKESASVIRRVGGGGSVRSLVTYVRRLDPLVVGSFAVLVFVNAIMFLPHYLGVMTYPWDFLAGYHAQTYAWISFPGFMFPAWLPWSDLGFPSILAIQDGAGYLPFVLLKIAGIEYSVEVATAIQASHAFVGSVGIFILIRAMGIPVLPALLAALGYQLGSGFYSNQQHSDIIRATAMFPWLLLAFHPRLVVDRRWGIPFSAFVLFQFLIAGYPGNIVAAAYTCGVLVGIHFLVHEDKLRYFLAVSAAVVGGLLMSMVKWFPLIVNSSYLVRGDVSVNPIDPIFFLTVVFPYDTDFLPSDLTMRSLWLPLVAVWGLVYCAIRSTNGMVGVAMIVLSLLVGSVLPLLRVPHDVLPGGGVSRFLVSDWRPTFQVGVLILSASGWARLLERRIEVRSFLIRTCAGFCAILALLVIGLLVGYSYGDLIRPLLVMGGAASVLCLAWNIEGETSTSYRAVALGLGLLIVFDGAMYQLGQDRAWRLEWNEPTEVAVFGGLIESEQPRHQSVQGRRLGRYLIESDPEPAIRGGKNTAYNKCWYEASYCVFGYNNLKLSLPHRVFADALRADGGRDLLDFIRRPQQLYVPSHGDRILNLDPVTHEDFTSGGGGLFVRSMRYEPSIVAYELVAAQTTTVIENEIWWPNWKAKLCTADGCKRIEVTSTGQGLRTWSIPAGEWVVVLEYQGVSRWKLLLLFVFGLSVALVASLFMNRWQREQ